MFSVTGWAITEWAGAIIAISAATTVIYRKVVMPVRAWWHSFKAWMLRIETATAWTEDQMKPNGGSTLVDKVDQLHVRIDTLHRQMARSLRNDSERDVEGKRYSNEPSSPNNTWEKP